jgi:hypothetical protein
MLRSAHLCVNSYMGESRVPLRYTLRPYQADVAQQVEQLTRNEQVSGSSPLVGSLFSRITLTGDTEATEEEYMSACLYSGLLTVYQRLETTHTLSQGSVPC